MKYLAADYGENELTSVNTCSVMLQDLRGWQGLVPGILSISLEIETSITSPFFLTSHIFFLGYVFLLFSPPISTVVDVLSSFLSLVWVSCHWTVYIQREVLHRCIAIVIPWVWAHSNQLNPNTIHQQSRRVHSRNGRMCNKDKTHL